MGKGFYFYKASCSVGSFVSAMAGGDSEDSTDSVTVGTVVTGSVSGSGSVSSADGSLGTGSLGVVDSGIT